MRAIELLRELNNTDPALLLKSVPTGFVWQRWAACVMVRAYDRLAGIAIHLRTLTSITKTVLLAGEEAFYDVRASK